MHFCGKDNYLNKYGRPKTYSLGNDIKVQNITVLTL